MFLQDIRFGLRTALKNKGVTAIAILCLAIGIGLNTMMFTVVDGVLIKPLPYRDPEQIVQLHTTQQRSGIRRGGLSWLDLRDWQERAHSFSAIAGMQGRSFTVSDQGNPERYAGAAIGHDLFPMLGIAPQVGRTFNAEDDRQGGEPVALLSDDLWRRRYGADPKIVGRSIVINSRPHTVVGIMPPRFRFPNNQWIWVPLAQYAVSTQRGERDLAVYARLKEGRTIEQARQEAASIAGALAAAFPDTNEGWGAYLRPLREAFIPADVRLIVLTMMGAVTLVLLIACFNVANLMLARASTRAREISIRTALGAGRGRLLRQLLTESVIVALASVPLGIVLAWLSTQLMNSSIPPDQLPYFIHWELDTRALTYTIGVAALTGIIFGLAPAIQASKADLQEALKESGRGMAGSGRGWIRNTLVVSEVALSLLLLVGASLFMRSFLNLRHASGGFDTAPLMTMRFYLPNEQYATPDAKSRRVEDILRRVEALPGVQAAFASNLVPLGSGGGDSTIAIDGQAVAKGDEPNIGFTAVSPHLLRTLGLPIIRGRDFTDTEGVSRAPVAVINEAMAKKFWPKEDPIGRRFRVLDDDTNREWFTIIGITSDFRHNELDDFDPIAPCAYVPFPYGAFPNTGLTIRAAGDPSLIAGPAREQIRASDPSLAVFQAITMEALRQRGYWQFWLFGWMFSMFGGIALLLAAVGVYGVLSYSVAQRTPEIGVRVALGAARSDVLKLIIVEGVKLAIIGVVLGALGSFFVTPVVRTQLYNVSPTDPLSFLAVSLFLTSIAFLASYLPARRATAVDPLVALRAE
jgi:putative ABC transport system permease protein